MSRTKPQTFDTLGPGTPPDSRARAERDIETTIDFPTEPRWWWGTWWPTPPPTRDDGKPT